MVREGVCFFRQKVCLHSWDRSWQLTLGLLALAVLGVGCTKADMYVYRFNPTDFAPEDAITVIQVQSGKQEYSDKLEKKVVGCIKDALENTHPMVRIVPPEDFRRAAFPDLTPAEILSGDALGEWEQLAKDLALATRIAPLDLRYVIIVSGGTRTYTEFAVAGYAWAATWDKLSNLRARIIDLKQRRGAGIVGGFASGGTIWLFPPVPLIIPTTDPEGRACRELGEGVAKFLAGKKLPEEKWIWPAMREEGAEPLALRSLAIDEKALGPDHPDVAISLNNLALLYETQGKYAEAEPLYKRALAIREKALGPDHPDVAISLSTLAQIYQAQGKYAEAEPLYTRALVISEKALGPHHPEVATVLENMAKLCKKTGRLDEAKRLEARAQEIRSRNH